MQRTSTKGFKRILFKGRRYQPCAYCEQMLTIDAATFDHVIPLSRGGYNKAKNGAIACATCNSEKGSMSVQEYLAFRYARDAGENPARPASASNGIPRTTKFVVRIMRGEKCETEFDDDYSQSAAEQIRREVCKTLSSEYSIVIQQAAIAERVP